MDTWNTQYSRESHLTALHHRGTISNKEDGVHFWSPKPQLCRLAWDINFAGLKEKLTPKVQLQGDELEIVRIIYRYPTMGDNNTVQWSAMDVKNDDDVRVMLEAHAMFELRSPLQLYIETTRTVAEILRRFTPPAQMKALGVKANEKVKFAYSINIRRLLEPPLPVGYWGNGCVAMFAQLSAKDLIEQPIWKTAELIRKSKSNVSEEYVRSFIDYQKLHFAEGVTTGKWVTWFMDWRHLGHSTVDFGWGGPVTVLPLEINSVDPCYFLPYSTASATGEKKWFKVLVTLTEASLSAFRRDMQLFVGSQEQ